MGTSELPRESRSGLISFLFFILCGCATSPTGRSQLILLPSSQMDQMGRASFEEVKKKESIEANPQVNQRIVCISKNITESLDRDRSGWEVVVFRSKTINAFALPGKKIGVYTGLIDISENDAQLASVIGHEVGHVVAEHGNERVSQNLVTQVGLAGLQLAVNGEDKKSQMVMLGAMGLAQFGVLLPFSRKHESEADELGQVYMARAGYDPNEAAKFWRIMRKKAGGAPPELLSTHPSPDTRIHDLERSAKKVWPIFLKAQEQGKGAPCG